MQPSHNNDHRNITAVRSLKELYLPNDKNNQIVDCCLHNIHPVLSGFFKYYRIYDYKFLIRFLFIKNVMLARLSVRGFLGRK